MICITLYQLDLNKTRAGQGEIREETDKPLQVLVAGVRYGRGVMRGSVVGGVVRGEGSSCESS
jgi:hypothetical protein